MDFYKDFTIFGKEIRIYYSNELEPHLGYIFDNDGFYVHAFYIGKIVILWA